MSDFIKLRATISGDWESVSELHSAHFADGSFDYNTVIPMPRELAGVDDGSNLETGYAALFGDWASVAKQWMFKEPAAALGLPWPLESREQVIAAIGWFDCAEFYFGPARAFHANITKYGHGSWFSWAKEHWGTPWNGNATPLEAATYEGTLHLRVTLPSYPSKVFGTLSKQYSGLSFLIQYVHEYERRGRSFVLRNGRELEKHKIPAAEIAKAVHTHPTGAA